MPFNGSGTYSAPSLPGSFNPAVIGQQATPADWTTLLADISTALSTAICKDGQTTITADIPMANHKLTGLANGSAATDSVAYGQVFGIIRYQTFGATGTYTPNPNMLYCVIECWGGGGGGGGCASGAANIGAAAGGGGGGAFASQIASAATIGAFKTVTVGPGGLGGAAGNNVGSNGNQTSVGAICVAQGGIGGNGSAGSGLAAGGAGGGSGTGVIIRAGQAGGAGASYTNGLAIGGEGGSSFGFGARGPVSLTASGGTAAGTNTGGGGSGGVSFSAAGNVGGGAGADGYVRITEFCWA